ncbi:MULTISPECIES: hypothetical protein [unclassified Breznakia]|uniref:hypothetical protein n=1 Tax=unclassified Breznakia TaxID=2623764 RepID=UPI002475FDCE|nr:MULTISPECIES: hypothetical protein [unclassified Breznakia]MDH6367492.1 major membrane immunogen (membrane-anchored lipoprotein) [Breznakia sp. PH1-1]MDH6404612.1 major membrane immunogen (membrane-anchored lipoprotein) [Breznakia sp. PF1-11]MDH6412321.1 major membrane immunogen (membrane-anchored lipoprotein) [Breznakia sp. PFB1-11]MDH6414659.1 major membrane immunogen (membrane-anchored lipoprotein) [Breznakia sp. PFB1-14]MDH6416946.1 major membrane immunogen (membrane-anchored lipoprotei
MKKTIIGLFACLVLVGCANSNKTVCTFSNGSDSYEITIKEDGDKIGKIDYMITSIDDQYKDLKEEDIKNFEATMQKQVEGKKGIEIEVEAEEDALSMTFKLDVQELETIPDVLLNSGKTLAEIKAMSVKDFTNLLKTEGATCK